MAAGSRIVRIGVYQNPPKIFLSNKRISGIFGDLIYNIADREAWTVVPVHCHWQQCLAMVRSGKIDLMPDVAYNNHRAQHMAFGKVPALYSWSQIYRRPDTILQTINDLAGKRVAVLAGSVQQTYLAKMLKAFGVHNVQLVPAPSYAQAFHLTAQGKTVAVAANYFFGDAAALKYHLRRTPIIFEPAQLYFVTPKGRNAALRADIDTYLSRWEADPSSPYYHILRRWRANRQVRSVPPAVWWGVGILAGLLVYALALTWRQRRRMVQQSRDLEISERKLADILDSLDAYVYVKDLDCRFQYANQHVTELFGLPRSAIIGQSNDILFDADTAARVRADDERVLREGVTVTLEEETRSKDGRARQFVTVKQPLRDANGQIYALVGVSTDLTAHKRNEEKIHQLAFYDPLTNLPNRTLLLDRAQHALDTYTRTRSDGALLFLDLDNFKTLNDTLGHAKGDLLLQRVTGRLQQHIRHNDTLARLGGDEFVLLMEGLGNDYEEIVGRLMAVGDKLRHALADEPYVLDDVTYHISASIGIAVFSDAVKVHAELTQDVLLKQADMAMYAAKSAGRDAVKFFGSTRIRVGHFS